jgi:GntR family transcriptional repressor for pyruvate dehydrogenase complex
MLEPLERTTLRGQVVDVLKAHIASEGAAAGSKLPTERELSQGLAVSRTVIREALGFLEAQGIIARQTSIGYFTTAEAARLLEIQVPQREQALTDLRRACEARLALEGGALPIVIARATPAQLEALLRQANQLDDAIRRLEARAEAEVEFHSAVVGITDNPLLVSLARRTFGDFFRAVARFQPAHFTRPRSEMYYWHAELVQFLQAGDLRVAQVAFWEHGRRIGEADQALLWPQSLDHLAGDAIKLGVGSGQIPS